VEFRGFNGNNENNEYVYPTNNVDIEFSAHDAFIMHAYSPKIGKPNKLI
jgi:hypothetical protein